MDETVNELKEQVKDLEKKVEDLETALKEQQHNIQLCYETLDLLTQRYAADRTEISTKFIDVENVVSLSLAMMQNIETLMKSILPLVEQLNQRIAALENGR